MKTRMFGHFKLTLSHMLSWSGLLSYGRVSMFNFITGLLNRFTMAGSLLSGNSLEWSNRQ